ncbi:hypothetical protein BV898_13792 [Hypsibius exemplaris]|uniref:Secreted protein n=1 Tax=Hypsibius exemplaris TaxID=2072580 RepID=A0A1W0W9M0_HYPEX|nr:hypothetical protein BV898_13792 [Hypsibius exemplaris]
MLVIVEMFFLFIIVAVILSRQTRHCYSSDLLRQQDLKLKLFPSEQKFIAVFETFQSLRKWNFHRRSPGLIGWWNTHRNLLGHIMSRRMVFGYFFFEPDKIDAAWTRWMNQQCASVHTPKREPAPVWKRTRRTHTTAYCFIAGHGRTTKMKSCKLESY